MDKQTQEIEPQVNKRAIEHRAWKENAEHCSWCDKSGYLHAVHKIDKTVYGFACPYCRASFILGLSIPQWNNEKHREKFDPVNLNNGFKGF